jgi:hypothetical protein
MDGPIIMNVASRHVAVDPLAAPRLAGAAAPREYGPVLGGG